MTDTAKLQSYQVGAAPNPNYNPDVVQEICEIKEAIKSKLFDSNMGRSDIRFVTSAIARMENILLQKR